MTNSTKHGRDSQMKRVGNLEWGMPIMKADRKDTTDGG